MSRKSGPIGTSIHSTPEKVIVQVHKMLLRMRRLGLIAEDDEKMQQIQRRMVSLLAPMLDRALNTAMEEIPKTSPVLIRDSIDEAADSQEAAEIVWMEARSQFQKAIIRTKHKFFDYSYRHKTNVHHGLCAGEEE